MNLKELRTALQERREDYSASDAKLNRRINQSYLDICSRRKWGWLRREFTANTYASVSTSGITLSSGSRAIEWKAASPPATVLGKRIVVGGSFYRVVDLDSTGTNGVLDRPFIGTTAAGLTGTIVYDEIALPLGAQTVVEAVLFTGTNSFPNSLEAIKPASMNHRDKGPFGQPTKYSAMEKEPIFRPRTPIGTLTPASVGVAGLTPGSVYKYWYTFVDKQTGAESALSDSTSVTLSSTHDGVTLPAISARKDLLLRLYRSTAGGSIPFLLSDMQSESISTPMAVTDTEPDEYLGARGPSSGSSMFLTLYPAPNSHYQIQMVYQMEASSLDDDNDRPLFDATFSSVLLDGAEALMLTAEDEQRRASSATAKFEAGIQRMISSDSLSFQDRVLIGRGSRRLRGKRTWWYGALGS